MTFTDLLVRIAGTLFAALVAVLAIYIAVKLFGKFLKIVVSVIVTLAVIFVVWFLWSRGYVPDLKSISFAVEPAFFTPLWV